MAVILAYGSPAPGHLFPMGALLRELAGRGHQVHLLTLASEVAAMPPVGLHTDAVRRFVDHRVVLDRAICAITHGGMGTTVKALNRGVPVCVVPFARDQAEVARRVQMARCGTRLPARKLTVARLRAAVREAMTMKPGGAPGGRGIRRDRRSDARRRPD